jgi:hypothetical protein
MCPPRGTDFVPFERLSYGQSWWFSTCLPDDVCQDGRLESEVADEREIGITRGTLQSEAAFGRAG